MLNKSIDSWKTSGCSIFRGQVKTSKISVMKRFKQESQAQLLFLVTMFSRNKPVKALYWMYFQSETRSIFSVPYFWVNWLWGFKNKQNDFKNKQTNVCKSMYILKVYSMHYIHWDKTQMLKKIPLDKRNGTKFFLSRPLTHHSFTFSLWFLYKLRFVSLKLCMGFSIFDSATFWLKFIFCLKKCMDSLTLKSHNSFQNKNATHSFASRPLIFKLQQEVLKFNDIRVRWSSPKTDL